MRYILLLESLAKSTDESHSDAAPLKAAWRRMRQFSDLLNRRKRELEDEKQLKELLDKFENVSFRLITEGRRFLQRATARWLYAAADDPGCARRLRPASVADAPVCAASTCQRSARRRRRRRRRQRRAARAAASSERPSTAAKRRATRRATSCSGSSTSCVVVCALAPPPPPDARTHAAACCCAPTSSRSRRVATTCSGAASSARRAPRCDAGAVWRRLRAT